MTSVSQEFSQVNEGNPADSDRKNRRRGPAGSRGFYLVAAMSLAVSVDTSWRFFGERLGITAVWERAIMFAVVEVALIACGYAMRAGVQSALGRPGPARLVAWLLCGLSAYMALDLSGPIEGVARVALGPILGLVMLHLALGIEIRHGASARMTTWAKIGRELRERVLSRLGLADDERDALARTRDRAAGQVAHLAVAPVVPMRRARLRRALRASNVAHDPVMRTKMLAELAAVQHMNELAKLDQPSPWLAAASSLRAEQADEQREPALALVPAETTVEMPAVTGVDDEPIQDEHTSQVLGVNKATAIKYAFVTLNVPATDEGKSLVPAVVEFLAARGRHIDSSYAYDVHRRWRENGQAVGTNGHSLNSSN